ncbi:MAG TPA: PQQ-dependent sugar dehydrogenase, partial [Candidatus Saccharimonadales bacterium]|nr:PQQ-dependent sugar dehydrogenase [Candidatus Saccharimonadales bacterium]
MKTNLKRLSSKTLATLVLSSLFLGLFPRVPQVQAASLTNTGAPAGFQISQIVTGLTLPTATEFAPDGRMFIIQKDGTVKIFKNGSLLAQPFYSVANVNNYVDRGLLGLALDPNFATNGFVYLLFTYDNDPANPANAKTGRLIRVTANGDIAVAGSEKIILGNIVGNPSTPSCDNYPGNSDCLPADSLSHAPGTVKFAPDGKLIVSVGDGAGYDNVDTKALRTYDMNSLAG